VNPAPDASSSDSSENFGRKLPFGARLARYRLFLVLSIGVFALDQATKWLVAARFPFNPRHFHGGGFDRSVIDGFFYLIHVGNTGAAWSMFAGQGVLLAALAALTLAGIYFWRHALGLRSTAAQISFGLLCGGIVGNLVDRLMHGHVIDFIDLHFGSYVYPTFNVADSGICLGVLLYLWQNLREPN
jgi:signal peptidase II